MHSPLAVYKLKMNWLGGAKKRLRLMGASVSNSDVPIFKRKALKMSEGFQTGPIQLPLNHNIQDEIFNRFYYKEQLLPQFIQEKERLSRIEEEKFSQIHSHRSEHNNESNSTVLHKKEFVSTSGQSIAIIKTPAHPSSGLLRRSNLLSKEADKVSNRERSPEAQDMQSKQGGIRLDYFRFKRRIESQPIFYTEPSKLRLMDRIIPNTDGKKYGSREADERVGRYSGKGQKKRVEFVTPKKKNENI